MKNLHELPQLRDSLTYLYVEHAVIEKGKQGIEYWQKDGHTMVPTANLSLLMMGPGTSITHAAVALLTQTGCTVLWVGQDGTKFYAEGSGETRQARRLIHQAKLVSDPSYRQKVVLRMYDYRFHTTLDPDLTLPQIRGKEGVRMRELYAKLSEKHNVAWDGRTFEKGQWQNTDPINRAISSANALLNGLCHSAIVGGGYSPALGFIHNGKQRSFVFDISDLYKSEITIPLAFEVVGSSADSVDSRVRALCRQRFKEQKLLQRILPDIDQLLDFPDDQTDTAVSGDIDADDSIPTPLWDQLL